jgi:hypothetical protein
VWCGTREGQRFGQALVPSSHNCPIFVHVCNFTSVKFPLKGHFRGINGHYLSQVPGFTCMNKNENGHSVTLTVEVS